MDDLIRRKDVMKVFTASSDGKRISEIDIDGFCTSVNIRDVKCYMFLVLLKLMALIFKKL